MSYPISSSLLDGIVLAVVERESTYGYRITQDVQKVLDISESTLYPVLRRLMKDGCLTTYDQAYAGRNRRYYQITEHGRAALRQHRIDWQNYRSGIDTIFFWRGERMNRADYMAALRRALSVLPEEERANALRYYEEYFDDAGPENETKAIEELGEPAKVAAQILADYRELTAVPHAQPMKEKRRWRGISPLLLIVLVLLAIPIGLPLVFGAGATVLGVLLAIVVTVLAVIFAVLLILYGIPLALICGGAVIALLSCTLWATPANALVTLGNGLAAFAAGILLGLLSIKLSILFVPPVFRAFVAVLRAPFNWIRNRCRRTGGGNV